MNKLIELYLKNQIRIEQLKSGLVRDWGKHLQLLDKTIKELLISDELRTLNKRELDKRLKALNRAINDVFNQHWNDLSVSLDDIAEIEATQTASALKEVGIKAVIPSLPTNNTPLLVSGIAGGMLLNEWHKYWTNTERKRLINAIRKGAYLKQPNAEILQTVRGRKTHKYRDGILAQTDRHTKTKINTSVSHTVDWAKRTTHKANGVELEQWVAMLESHTCAMCRVLDHEILHVDNPPYAPAHHNCRCFRVPYVKSLGDLNYDDERPSETGKVDGKINYYEWLKQQSASYQDSILGKARGEIFRSKGMTVDKFKRLQLDRQFKQRTVNDIKRELFPDTFIEPKVDTKALQGARFQTSKLKRKYKHADMFNGLDAAKSNPRNWKKYQDKIVEFMNDPNVVQRGVYKSSNPANKVWYNNDTQIAVVFDENNYFVTSLKLTKGTKQYDKYMNEGFLW
ncbi:phage minor head protein [Phocoenobacter skyensis]|uniref:Colicin D domain-containing protein n=1 Tax=Phocoenobacter skyensis TaxID=97481 RepID=A0ABT9JIF8_9PAST|nr:colicin D domain-containing protein [Pasteurella skyensis]MDP8078345.1 colicin D domain-containing protein [Pasteurella skyensis]MDP8084563.1 colicin D domain-containing protein [Pasteurella skyensis]